MIQYQTQNRDDLGLVAVLVILLILSAWQVTSKAAVWIGLFLLFIVIMSAWETGALKGFGAAFMGTTQGAVN